MRRILDDQGYQDVTMMSFTSADGYAGIGDQAGEVIRTAWRAVVVQDILLKLLLMTRPYEVNAGDTDKVYLDGLDIMEAIIAEQGLSNKERMVKLKAGLSKVKTAFTAIPVKQEDRPLIGVVGEIFCRLNTFSNNELLRHIEAQGGECWLTGIGEWVLYTNNEAFRRLREEKRRVSKEWLRTFLTYRIMHKDEKALHGGLRAHLRAPPRAAASPRCSSAPCPTCPRRGRWARWCSPPAAPSPTTSGAPTA